MSFAIDSYTLHGSEAAGEDLALHVSAEDGGSWSKVSGSGGGITVGSDGYISPTNTAAWDLYVHSVLEGGAGVSRTIDVFLGSATNSDSFGIGLLLRMDGSNNGYALIFAINNSVAGTLSGLIYTVAGGALASQVGTVGVGPTWTQNTTYRIKAQAIGSALSLKFSTDGGTTYTTLVSGTDGTYTAAGKSGVIGYRGATANFYKGTNFAILNLTAGTASTSSVASTSLTLSTTAATGGNASSYSYQAQQYSNSTGTGGAWGNVGPNSAATSLNVTGLTPSTTYIFRWVVTDGDDATDATATTTATTSSGGASITPGTVSLSAVLDTSLHASTSAASGGSGTISYEFEIAPDVSGSPGSWTPSGVISTATAYTFPGLTSSTKYWVRCVVTDTASDSANSSAVSATTLKFVPVNDANVIISGMKVNGSTNAVGNNPGDSARLEVSGTSLYALFDVSRLVSGSVASNLYPRIRWQVSSGSAAGASSGIWHDYQLLSSDRAVPLGTGLTPNTQSLLYVDGLDVNTARFGNLPVSAAILTGFLVDPTAATVPLTGFLAARSAVAYVEGDSIDEGVLANGSNPADYVNGTSGQRSWGRIVSDSLDAEFFPMSWGGGGLLTGANGGVPACWSVDGTTGYMFNWYTGASRVSNGRYVPQPTYIFNNAGYNDLASGVQSATFRAGIVSWLTASRSLAPTAMIYYVITPTGVTRSDVLAAFATYGGTVTTTTVGPGSLLSCSGDANAFVIDPGSLGPYMTPGYVGGFSGTSNPTSYSADGLHLSQDGHAMFAAFVGGCVIVSKSLGSGSGSGASTPIGCSFIRGI